MLFSFESFEAFFVSLGKLLLVAIPAIVAFIIGVKKIIKTLRYENANGYNKKNNLAIEKNTKDIKEMKQDIKEIKAILKSKN